MPQRPDQARDFLYDMKFPLNGINTSEGFMKQPFRTAASGVNVRGFDASTNKARGGSRAGLTPFIGGAGSTIQVNGFNLVQSLSVIVTADPGAII